MYHDRGQIAAEPRGFDGGATATAGLQTASATPAHGTAFDGAGEGIAAEGAPERAVRLAAHPARRAGAADTPGPAA